MKKEFQISDNIKEVNEILHDWETMRVSAFCNKYNYDIDEVSEIIQGLVSDQIILTEKTEQENTIGVDNWKEEYAQLYNFL